MRKISCPRCGSLSHSIGGGVTTDMYSSPYTDKNGDYHHHDPNSNGESRTCIDCKFRFYYSWYSRCKSCDYGKDSNTISWGMEGFPCESSNYCRGFYKKVTYSPNMVCDTCGHEVEARRFEEVNDSI